MKKPHILVFWNGAGLGPLETILQRSGYQVGCFSAAAPLNVALRKERPDLLLMDRQAATIFAADRASGRVELPAGIPVIVVGEAGLAGSPLGFPCHHLPLPLDLMALLVLLSDLLDIYERRNLRMAVQLPGMFFRKGACIFCDILSLGTGGAFIKSGCSDLRCDETIDVIIPLMGMKKELELSCQVLYQIQPVPENNYLQGVGVSFSNSDPKTVQTLFEYISHSLMNESPFEPMLAPPTHDLIHAEPSVSRSRDGQRRLFLSS